ncbi:hypothetical protein [Zoogloea sp.]|uniref:hypothetical protein n=1 Tax=Zoogloea sp. TaxID=49181 RepID=UPI0035B15DD1
MGRRFFFRGAGAADWVRRGMRLPFILASVVCSLAWADGGEPPSKKSTGRKLGLTIQVQGGGWGRGRKESIETVLYAVADTLMSRLPPGHLGAPIVVTHTDGPPMALYGRGGAGEYRIRLHARDENWHLYVYEFAHELCHLLSNYDAQPLPAGAHRDNQWFEETLCETASLFTLRHLAQRWEAEPPGPEWAGEADRLRRFFDLLVSEGHRRLPPDAPLAAWLQAHEDELRHNPYLREKNEVLANLLLPLFERNPENWQALGYMNLDPDDARSSLRSYLSRWYANTPLAHRALVAGVLALLALDDVVPLERGSGPLRTAAK